jgi:hypothetical protein
VKPQGGRVEPLESVEPVLEPRDPRFGFGFGSHLAVFTRERQSRDSDLSCSAG